MEVVAVASKGVATLSTSKLTVGKHTITATYPGDTNYTEATSKALSESIDKVTPTVKLTSSLNPAAVAKGVTFKATVTGGAILPTGTVAFYAGTKQLGAATLSNGGASLSTSKLAAGKYDITAKYSGDSNDLIAESKALTETIDKLTPVVKLKSSTNPGTVGKAITFTATVTGGDGTPTGTVVFKSGKNARHSDFEQRQGGLLDEQAGCGHLYHYRELLRQCGLCAGNIGCAERDDR